MPTLPPVICILTSCWDACKSFPAERNVEYSSKVQTRSVRETWGLLSVATGITTNPSCGERVLTIVTSFNIPLLGNKWRDLFLVFLDHMTAIWILPFFFFSYVMKLGCPDSVEGVSGVEKRASAAWISYLGALGS